LILVSLMRCAPTTDSGVAGVVVSEQADAQSDPTDTLAEAFQLFIQWVNTTDVKVEFDVVVDNDPNPPHFELSAGTSAAILIAPIDEAARDPIGVAADNVSVLRTASNCPNEVVFENISYGDFFYGEDIPFAQAAAPAEGTLGVDSAGVMQPVSYICYSAWQVIVNNSSVTVTALDRQAGASDESEVDAAEAVRHTSSSDTTSTDTTTTTDTAPRPLAEIAPREVEGDPSIPAPSQ